MAVKATDKSRSFPISSSSNHPRTEFHLLTLNTRYGGFFKNPFGTQILYLSPAEPSMLLGLDGALLVIYSWSLEKRDNDPVFEKMNLAHSSACTNNLLLWVKRIETISLDPIRSEGLQLPRLVCLLAYIKVSPGRKNFKLSTSIPLSGAITIINNNRDFSLLS